MGTGGSPLLTASGWGGNGGRCCFCAGASAPHPCMVCAAPVVGVVVRLSPLLCSSYYCGGSCGGAVGRYRMVYRFGGGVSSLWGLCDFSHCFSFVCGGVRRFLVLLARGQERGSGLVLHVKRGGRAYALGATGVLELHCCECVRL